MKNLEFIIDISATKEKVWSVLWEDKSFRDWASIIDKGTFLKGEMQEGNTIQFINSINGYGVTSLITKLVTNEIAEFKHNSDTKDFGEVERDSEWTGGTERYELSENNGITTLKLVSTVPTSQVEMTEERYPKALGRIKALAETA